MAEYESTFESDNIFKIQSYLLWPAIFPARGIERKLEYTLPLKTRRERGSLGVNYFHFCFIPKRGVDDDPAASSCLTSNTAWSPEEWGRILLLQLHSRGRFDPSILLYIIPPKLYTGSSGSYDGASNIKVRSFTLTTTRPDSLSQPRLSQKRKVRKFWSFVNFPNLLQTLIYKGPINQGLNMFGVFW